MTMILPTRNEAWGFTGTMRRAGAALPDAWDRAFMAIARATDGEPGGIRDFLDSRHGRHFADSVCEFTGKGQSLEDAIHNTVRIWNGWKIGRSIQRETGIPCGLPYLTGWVHHFGLLAEAA